jgi:hypothetical protein
MKTVLALCMMFFAGVAQAEIKPEAAKALKALEAKLIAENDVYKANLKKARDPVIKKSINKAIAERKAMIDQLQAGKIVAPTYYDKVSEVGGGYAPQLDDVFILEEFTILIGAFPDGTVPLRLPNGRGDLDVLLKGVDTSKFTKGTKVKFGKAVFVSGVEKTTAEAIIEPVEK